MSSRTTRRTFLLGSTLAAATLALPAAARIAPPLAMPAGDRSLGLKNLHTNEAEWITYFRNGRYDPAGLAAMNRFLRDWRSGDIAEMDQGALDILWMLARAVGKPDTHFGLISAYRSPKTNAALRAMGRGVAKRSYHMQGKAIDIQMHGVEPTALANAAHGMQAGGVGLYRRSGFVHVDTGPVRRWGF